MGHTIAPAAATIVTCRRNCLKGTLCQSWIRPLRRAARINRDQHKVCVLSCAVQSVEFRLFIVTQIGQASTLNEGKYVVEELETSPDVRSMRAHLHADL